MLNAEKYKERIKELDYRVTIDINSNELKHCNEMNCCNCKFRDNDCNRKRTEWLLEEYKEPILTDEEKEYLKNLIKHFRNYIKYIERETEDFYNGEQLESINIWMEKGDIGNFTIIPIVETSLTFEGMEDERQYSLEELGL